MMASYQVTEHFDVHIFDCQADICAAAIERLKVAFSVTQYRCVAGYKPCECLFSHGNLNCIRYKMFVTDLPD